jgi:ABC-2 type transport system ATP-binding protein
LTGAEFLRYIAGLKGAPRSNDVSESVRMMDAEAFINKKTASMSMGQKRRVSFIAALINNPQLLILDEPTNSMDISTVIAIKNIIGSRAANGSITIVSSHVLDFIKNIATKIVFIKDGYTIDKD